MQATLALEGSYLLSCLGGQKKSGSAAVHREQPFLKQPKKLWMGQICRLRAEQRAGAQRLRAMLWPARERYRQYRTGAERWWTGETCSSAVGVQLARPFAVEVQGWLGKACRPSVSRCFSPARDITLVVLDGAGAVARC